MPEHLTGKEFRRAIREAMLVFNRPVRAVTIAVYMNARGVGTNIAEVGNAMMVMAHKKEPKIKLRRMGRFHLFYLTGTTNDWDSLTRDEVVCPLAFFADKILPAGRKTL
jgi:hypothetical protein